MEKFLLVIDAADDAAMFPVSGLRAVTCAADATVLLQFAPGIHDPTGDDADADLVTLTCTADKEKDIVYYDQHAGHSIQHKDILYQVIRSGDVVLID